MNARLKRVLGNVALAGAAVVITVLVAEGAVRLLPQRTAADTDHLITEYDSLLGWRKRPEAVERRVTSEYEIEVRTNAAGLRGPDYPPEPPANVYRVLLLGDSFAEGYTVEEADGVAAALERTLSGFAPGGFQVINGGTRGYSTDQEYLFFGRDGRRYHPDLTILLFYVNDVWFNTQDRYWRGFKPVFRPANDTLALENVPVPEPDTERFAFEIQGGRGLARLARRTDAWLGTHSALYPMVRTGLQHVSWISALMVRTGFAAVPDEFRPWRTTPDPDLEMAWHVTGTLLGLLRDTVVATGSRFAILHVPPRPSVRPADWRGFRRRHAMSDDAWDAREDARRLGGICERLDLTCLFPADRFRALEAEGQRLYFDDDAHWNAAGHRLAAEILGEYVASVAEPSLPGRPAGSPVRVSRSEDR